MNHPSLTEPIKDAHIQWVAHANDHTYWMSKVPKQGCMRIAGSTCATKFDVGRVKFPDLIFRFPPVGQLSMVVGRGYPWTLSLQRCERYT